MEINCGGETNDTMTRENLIMNPVMYSQGLKMYWVRDYSRLQLLIFVEPEIVPEFPVIKEFSNITKFIPLLPLFLFAIRCRNSASYKGALSVRPPIGVLALGLGFAKVYDE